MLAALVNFLHFAGLTLAVGSVVSRYLLMNRSGLTVTERAPVLRDAAKYGMAGGAAVLAAAPLRAMLQASALVVPGESWSAMLVTVVTETGLGRALQLQAIWGAGTILAFSVARLGAARGWSAAVFTTLVSAMVPALTGHAAAAEPALPAQVAAVMHVLGAGAWIGGLFQLWRIARKAADVTIVSVLRAFHPVALGGATLLAVSGGYHVFSLVDAPSRVFATRWGALLLAKLLALGGVLALGYRHWRGAEAQAVADRAALRASMERELWFALAVLLLTGGLTTQSPVE